MRSFRVVAAAVLAAHFLTPTAAHAATLALGSSPASAAANSLVDTTVPANRWLVRIHGGDGSCSGALITQSWLLTRDGCPTTGDIDAGGQIRRATFTARQGRLLLARLDTPVTGFTARTLATQDPAAGTDVWRYSGGNRYLDEYVKLAARTTDANLTVSGTPGTFVRGDEGGPVTAGDTLVGITDYPSRYTEDGYLDVTGPIGVLSVARHRQWLLDTMAANPPLVIKFPTCPIFVCPR
ncbi:hypothetical protein KOI35_03915 [Actinoplanes bogorensis]|uniref:Trypsin n=1 Tax=Paractinoplanes bogorensis TaxID=1610840 RepID=A0ABS5YIV1_9ACTN|nr:hypothetical protein [Actinoplanes bogorensis]MBU2662644.1 hypothetical protein [Actinoplanes bogorensis]